MNKGTRTLTAMSAGLVAVAVIVAAGMAGTATSAAEETDHDAHGGEHASPPHSFGNDDFQHALEQVRRATDRFHDLDTAKAAGYELGWVNGDGNRIIAGCVANAANPAAGAMGYHYFNADLMADDKVNLLEPEVLVYATGDDGVRELVAVEWAARGPNSNPPGPAKAPRVLGMPMHILVPAVGFHIMHAWLWQPNPTGMFADWNPDVTCP
jgi:hypothetical protein